MKHDALCPINPADQLAPEKCWRCALIARVREDERRKLLEAISWVQDLDEALDVITAICEWDKPPPLPATKGVPTSAMWPARGNA